MCGIAGFMMYDGEPASPVVLRRMTEAVAHRGPDDEGHHIAGSVGLGHRRLAVIDPTPAGHQPMMTEDGRFVLTYNGELYNFEELRAVLEAHGHRFHSRTDSEVVLKAFARWGVAALHRFNGIFAFAVWDGLRRELTLARDRHGVKPLYVAQRPEGLLFGSEVKALLAHPALSARMDLSGLAEYLAFQNFVTERTLFEDVRMLAPGSYAQLREGERTPRVTRYWDFDFAEPERIADEREVTEELAHRFERAVSRQLVADVPVGAYLSGGMDSGSIAAVAASQLRELRTFTVGFDLSSATGMELAFDERASAEALSYHCGSEHYEMVLKAGDMERTMARLVWHLEEPRVGQSYPNYYAALLASKFGKVVLSGTGGDETFAGYPWRYYRAVVNRDFDHYVDKYAGIWQRLLAPAERRAVLAPIWSDVGDVDPRAIVRGVFGERSGRPASPAEYVNRSLYFDARTFLHGLLVVEDKLSMAHGLEARVPFLDNDLVDFAMRVSVGHKLGRLSEVVGLGELEPGPRTEKFCHTPSDGKLVLRRAMEQFVPLKTTQRNKQGFSAPDASWYRGESIDYVRRRLMRNDAPLWDVLDRDTVHGLVTEHLEGRQNRRLLVWSLLSLDEWCRAFLEGESPAATSAVAQTR